MATIHKKEPRRIVVTIKPDGTVEVPWLDEVTFKLLQGVTGEQHPTGSKPVEGFSYNQSWLKYPPCG